MLSRAQILERIGLPRSDPRALVIEPSFLENDSFSIDLHFSGRMVRFHPQDPEGEELNRDTTRLRSRDFALASSLEFVRMPHDLSGEIVGRSIWGRRGLLVASAGRIDPAFSGQITFELANVADVPLVLTRGVAIGQLFLHHISEEAQPQELAPMGTALAVAPNGGVAPFRILDVVRMADLGVRAEPWVERDPAHGRHAEVIEKLETLIRRPDATEAEIQRFFEHHSWLLLGNEYTEIRPQVVLHRSNQGTLRPDFFLKPVVGESWDILDLKLPQIRPLVVGRSDRRMYSQKVASGIAQLKKYGQYFDDAINRRWAEARHGIFAYRPRLILLIGVAFEDEQRESRIDVRRSSDVEVVTYEELVRRVRHRTNSSE